MSILPAASKVIKNIRIATLPILQLERWKRISMLLIQGEIEFPCYQHKVITVLGGACAYYGQLMHSTVLTILKYVVSMSIFQIKLLNNSTHLFCNALFVLDPFFYIQEGKCKYRVCTLGALGAYTVHCTVYHRRRIELEGNAKVVASDWGTESLLCQLFCLTSCFALVFFETNG